MIENGLKLVAYVSIPIVHKKKNDMYLRIRIDGV